MEKRDNDNLVIEGNAFYEIDRECMERGLNRKRTAENKEGAGSNNSGNPRNTKRNRRIF